jgi:hypothetical protein
MSNDPIVLLALAPNEPLAQMWAEVLGDAGIKTMLKPLGPGLGAWASAATFEHEVFVLRSQLEAARHVLDEFTGEDAE